MLCLGRSFWFVDAGNGLHQIILGNVGRRERVHNLFGNAKNFRLFSRINTGVGSIRLNMEKHTERFFC